MTYFHHCLYQHRNGGANINRLLKVPASTFVDSYNSFSLWRPKTVAISVTVWTASNAVHAQDVREKFVCENLWMETLFYFVDYQNDGVCWPSARALHKPLHCQERMLRAARGNLYAYLPYNYLKKKEVMSNFLAKRHTITADKYWNMELTAALIVRLRFGIS